MNRTQREIMIHWKMADNDFSDKSTEFIISIVCDRYGCDHSDVINALWADNQETLMGKPNDD